MNKNHNKMFKVTLQQLVAISLRLAKGRVLHQSVLETEKMVLKRSSHLLLLHNRVEEQGNGNQEQKPKPPQNRQRARSRTSLPTSMSTKPEDTVDELNVPKQPPYRRANRFCTSGPTNYGTFQKALYLLNVHLATLQDQVGGTGKRATISKAFVAESVVQNGDGGRTLI